jgi:type II secretory pathway component PulM
MNLQNRMPFAKTTTLAIDKAWRQCSPREKWLLGIAVAMLVITLVVLLVSWLNSERQRLERNLPRTAAQLSQMREAADELTKLRTLPVLNGPSETSLIEAVGTSAKANGLDLTIGRDNEGLKIAGNGSFDSLVIWLGSLHKEYGLRVSRMEVQMRGDTSTIAIHLVSTSAN